MRALFLAMALAIATLGWIALTPSPAEAHPHGGWHGGYRAYSGWRGGSHYRGWYGGSHYRGWYGGSHYYYPSYGYVYPYSTYWSTPYYPTYYSRPGIYYGYYGP